MDEKTAECLRYIYILFIYLFTYLFIHSFILTQNHALSFKCGFEFHVDTPYTFVVTIFNCLILVKYEALF